MRRLGKDRRGVAALEFALAAPVFLLVILGGLEMGYSAYVRALLEGEMQRASRDRTLEDAGSAAQRALIENRVRDMVHRLAPTVTFTRRAFRDYATVEASHEPFNDVNSNGECDSKETFEDLNGNGYWDQTVGSDDSDGNARDVVIYTATVRHDRLLPNGFNPLGGREEIVARTALRNQPFNQQAAVVERSCP